MIDLGASYRLSLERSPDATALVDGDLRLSYAELFEKIRRAAGGLDRMGVKKGERVMIVLQNNWEMATLHWACQFLGVIATPLNWRIKGAELDYCLEDAEAAAVIFEEVSAEAIIQSKIARSMPRIGLSGTKDATLSFDVLLEDDGFDGQGRADIDDISVMLYTSGTTGRPKGVPRSHRAERAARSCSGPCPFITPWVCDPCSPCSCSTAALSASASSIPRPPWR